MSFCQQETCAQGKKIIPILAKLTGIYRDMGAWPQGKASEQVFAILQSLSTDMRTIHYYNCNNAINELSAFPSGQPLSGRNAHEKHFSSKHAYGQLQIFATMLAILELDRRPSNAGVAAITPAQTVLPPSVIGEPRCSGSGRFYLNRSAYVQSPCICSAVSSGFCLTHALEEVGREKAEAAKKEAELRAEVEKLSTPPSEKVTAPMPSAPTYASLVSAGIGKPSPSPSPNPSPSKSPADKPRRTRGGRKKREQRPNSSAKSAIQSAPQPEPAAAEETKSTAKVADPPAEPVFNWGVMTSNWGDSV